MASVEAVFVSLLRHACGNRPDSGCSGRAAITAQHSTSQRRPHYNLNNVTDRWNKGL